MLFTNLAHRSAVCTALLVAAMCAGCERSAPPPGLVLERNDTPQAQLRNAMRRLEDALSRAHAASTTGVLSERRCQYRLIEPKNEGDAYTASVTVETLVALDPVKVARRDEPPPKDGRKLVPISDVVEAAEAVSEVAKRNYKLVYKDRRWELDEPAPDDMPEVERLCFQLALSDG